VLLERLQLPAHLKLATTVALANLRAFREISAELGISMDALSPELVIERLTGHSISKAALQSLRVEVTEALNAGTLLTSSSKGTRRKSTVSSHV